jgi:hypothetical protein
LVKIIMPKLINALNNSANNNQLILFFSRDQQNGIHLIVETNITR